MRHFQLSSVNTGNSFALSALLVLSGLHATASVSYAQEDCPPPLMCPIDPPQTDAKPEVDYPSSQECNIASEQVFLTAGSRFPLFPLKQTRGVPESGRDSWALPLNQNSNNGSYIVPNWFSVAVNQALYQDDMWMPGKQAEQYAPQTIFMAGQTNTALAQIISGEGKTREVNSPWDLKYVIGSANSAIGLRGLSQYDRIAYVGVAGFGMVAQDNGISYEEGYEGNLDYLQNYTSLAEGAELTGSVGRQISEINPDGNIYTAVDGRNMNIKESDMWDLQPARVGFIMGGQGTAWVDNKRTGLDLQLGDICTDYSLVDFAIAFRANVGAGVKDAFVNVSSTRGVQTNFFIFEGFDHSPNAFCGNERTQDSVVRDAVGVEINYPAPQVMDGVDILNSVGLTVNAAAAPGMEGASPSISAATLGLDATTIDPQRSAAIIAKGDVILGDGRAISQFSGYDTSVTHINDVLHLVPRTAPPQIDANTPPSDRVGLVYFDATKNALRLSVALQEDQGSWQDSQIGWVTIPIDWDSFEPESDIAGARSETALAKAENKKDAVMAAHKAAQTSAASGDSAYLPPTVGLLDDRGAKTGVHTLTFNGFGDQAPTVYWRRLGHGKDAAGRTEWKSLDDTKMATAQVLPGGLRTLNLTLSELAETAKDGFGAMEGHVIQILAVSKATGQSAGLSFTLGEQAPTRLETQREFAKLQ